MSLRPTFRFLAMLVMFLSLCLFIPGLIDYFSGDTQNFYLFKIAGFSFIAVIPVWLLSRKARSFSNRDVFLVTVLGWVLTAIFGSFPFYFSGYFPSYPDALFEAVSGVTTTGATILTDIESLPKSILLWRAFLQWIGGLGIVVFTIALLPLLGVSGEKLFNLEFPGPSSEKMTPRIQETAKILLSFYVGFTFIEFLLLSYSSMGPFNALCHAFTTMPTGGFSTFNDSINTLYYVGLIVLISSVILLISYITSNGSSILDTIFQVVAILTSTGYTATNYELWTPYVKQFMLFGLMFVGAMGGSTSGGMKLIRVVAIFKYARMELKRALHPKAIIPIRIGSKIIEDEVIRKTLGFFLFYILFFFFASFAFSAMGIDMESSFGAAASGMGNIGPSLGQFGPTDTYLSLPLAGKFIMMFCMLLGRLEIFAVLVLFTKTYWRT